MSESNAAQSASSIDEMTTMVDVLLAQTKEFFVGVSYEVLVKPRVQGITKKILINNDTINLQPSEPMNSFDRSASEVAKLQKEYRVLAESAHNEYHRLREEYQGRSVDVELIRRQGKLAWTLKEDALPWPGRRFSTESSDSQYSSMNVGSKPRPARVKKYLARRLRRRSRYDSTYGSYSSDSSDEAEVPLQMDSEEELPEQRQYLTKIRRNPLSYYMDQDSD